MTNEDGTIGLACNGEIYNAGELRQRLEALGHRFRSRSDNEVIVHGYEQWGPECVTRLRGMFAFGLWDASNRRMLLARDRVGKKPLFYARTGRHLRFASEIQALLAADDVQRTIDLRAIDAYLSWGYVPAPGTAFSAISKLPPAHWMVVELDGAGGASGVGREGVAVRLERYWKLAYEPKVQLSETEATEALREKLTEAVRLRLASDVPLGAFLSGGIDSSIIVGLMAKIGGRSPQTFSIGFDEASYDELAHARRVAARWGTEHQEFVVQSDATAILPRLIRHFGEPFADSSAIPTFHLAKLTRQSVTVALTGDGGDESFAGYDRYRANAIAEQLSSVPGFAVSARAAKALVPGSASAKSGRSRARRFLAGAAKPVAARYGEWVRASAGLADEVKRQLYSAEFENHIEGTASADLWFERLFDQQDTSDPVDLTMAVDVESYLPYDLLVKVDTASMAHGLEARSPFLDHEMMELVARLPTGLKLHRGRSKYLLKRAFADLIPEETRARPKTGFAVPVGQWLRGPLRPLVEDALLSSQATNRGYFDPPALRGLLKNHLSGTADHGYALWNLLVLELWHREVVASPSPLIESARRT
jgi:asparagine synthase (glutamine-hydrolysing)